jgi:hypothetical protein
MLQPVNTFPEAVRTAAPTLKFENFACAFSRTLFAAPINASYSATQPPAHPIVVPESQHSRSVYQN